MDQLFGLETEYGLAAPEEQGINPGSTGAVTTESAVWDLVDAVRQMVPCLPDMGAGGVFLANGSRVYVDGGHPELATPEVSSPWDVVRYTVAGHRVLERALAQSCGASCRSRPLLFTSNVDYVTRSSWGCHESILYSARASGLSDFLIPHLV